MVKKLRDLSGFGWDEERKVVTAADDVWDKYIAVRDQYCMLLHVY